MLKVCGKPNGWYGSFDNLDLWEVIETIEMYVDLNDQQQNSDIYEALGVG